MFQVEQSKLSSILSILAALLATTRSEETTISSVPLIVERSENGNGNGNGNISSEIHDSMAPISEILRLPEALDADRMLEEQSRHFLCIPLLRIFNLELRQPLASGEHIALTGSHSRLGEWQLEKSIEMRSLDGDGKRLEWLAKVPICANERIAYRYFIYTLDAQHQKRIRIWEGQKHPRIMESYHIYRQPGIDYFGETASTAIDVGGREFPWLRYDRLIELKFIWQRQLKISPYVQHTDNARNIRLKLEVLGDKLHDSLIEVSRYAYNRSRFRQQPENGVRYNFNADSEDIVIFRIMEPLRVRRSYKLRIFSMDRIEFGYVAILNIDLRRSEGVLSLPVHSGTTGFDIGRLILPYLIVRPLPRAKLLDMRDSFQHYWPLNWPTMHVGNRGTGKSFYDSKAPFVENTIKSFLHVHTALHGDMIELDVQLTKDYVPVVWHEDGIYTAPVGRHVQSLLDLDYLLIRDMSYNELKRRRIFVLKSPEIGIEEYTHLNVRHRNVLERIFPRLTEVYRQLPKSIGLIVDITWPQFLADDIVRVGGSLSMLDKNRYVNRIIALTARYGCGRPLIFASFDTDICVMLRYKQNIYPTMFLTTGDTKLWQPYKDLRTQSFTNAVNFAQSEFLLGTAPHVVNFFEKPQKMMLGLELIQVVFLWGEELQNDKIIRKFQKLHATGLIYDRIDLYRPHDQRHAFFGAKELLEIFGKQCLSPLRNASSKSGGKLATTNRRKFFTIYIEH